MIVLLAALLGAAIGAYTARSRGGKPADMAQYAFGYGVAFGVVALIATLVLRAV